MDTNPQYKLEERHEEGNLPDTLCFLDNYGSERLMRKEEACGEGRTHISTNHLGKSFSWVVDCPGLSGCQSVQNKDQLCGKTRQYWDLKSEKEPSRRNAAFLPALEDCLLLFWALKEWI